MRNVPILIALLLFGSAIAAEPMSERRIASQDVGTVVFKAPEKWKGVESYDDLEAATIYEISARKDKFNLRISIKNSGFDSRHEQLILDELVIAKLDGYLDYAMADYVGKSVEGAIHATRFGKRNHGVYARITDKNPGKGEFLFYTHGARILGNKFIAFSLFSSDKDQSILSTTLDVISSFRSVFEWANAPDSYVCNVEQLVGFAVAEKNWDTVSSKSIKQSYIVRRSKPGDLFADTSEWVFSEPNRETTKTYCDNELVARGVFICNGMYDEEFRMDSQTLRFVYAYVSGYHDVPRDEVPDEKRRKPHMEIGSCVAQ